MTGDTRSLEALGEPGGCRPVHLVKPIEEPLRAVVSGKSFRLEHSPPAIGMLSLSDSSGMPGFAHRIASVEWETLTEQDTHVALTMLCPPPWCNHGTPSFIPTSSFNARSFKAILAEILAACPRHTISLSSWRNHLSVGTIGIPEQTSNW